MFERREFQPIPLAPKPNILSRHKKLAATVVLATSGVSVAGASYGQYMIGDPMAIPSWAGGLVFEYSCPKVAVQTQNEVTVNFNNNTPDWNLTEETQLERAQDIAEKHGFTLIDSSEFRSQMTNSATPHEAVGVLTDFFKAYGSRFSMPSDHEIQDLWMSYEPVTAGEVDLKKFKTSSLVMFDLFSLVPKEVIEAGNINRIKLVKKLAEGRLAGSFEAYTRNLFIDIDSFYTASGPKNVLHETGHGIDSAFCGNSEADDDPEFTALNEEGFRYMGNNWSSASDISQRFVMRAYGFKKPSEDKTTVLEELLPGYIEFDQYGVVLQAKTILLLARLETKIPGISEYYREINMRRPFKIG